MRGRFFCWSVDFSFETFDTLDEARARAREVHADCHIEEGERIRFGRILGGGIHEIRDYDEEEQTND